MDGEISITLSAILGGESHNLSRSGKTVSKSPLHGSNQTNSPSVKFRNVCRDAICRIGYALVAQVLQRALCCVQSIILPRYPRSLV